MRAILESITVKNFMGVEEFHANFDPVENTIEAANGVGKTTTLVHAPSWCMFGTDGYGNSKFDLKPFERTNDISGELGKRIEGLETFVEVAYDIDGEKIIFTKEAIDEYAGKDEEGNRILKGLKYKYSIDGFEVKATEYKAKIDAMFDGSKFPMLSQTSHFMLLHWEKQREFIMQMTPDVTDKNTFDKLMLTDQKSKFEFLAPFIEKNITMADVKKRAKTAEEKSVIERDKTTPAIVENTRNIVSIDFKKIEAEMVSYEADLAILKEAEINPAILAKANNAERVEIEKRINVLNDTMFNIKNKITKEVNGVIQAKINEKEKCGNDLILLKTKIEGTESRITEKKKELADTETAIEKRKEEYAKVKEKVFDAGSPKCSHGFHACAALTEKFENDKFSLAEAFEKGRDAELTIINDAGKRLHDKKSLLKSEMSLLENTLEGYKFDQTTLTEQYNSFGELVPTAINFSEWPSVIECQSEIDETVASLTKFQTAPAIDNSKIKELEEKITNCKIELSKEQKNTELKARVKELEKDKLKYSDEVAMHRRQIIAIDEFVAILMKDVEQAVNVLFTNIKFKLFEKNGVGNIENKCIAMLDGVPYSVASYSQKIVMGLDFIKTASAFLNMYYPVSIDNRESITEIPKMDTQIFNLKVNPERKQVTLV